MSYLELRLHALNKICRTLTTKNILEYQLVREALIKGEAAERALEKISAKIVTSEEIH